MFGVERRYEMTCPEPTTVTDFTQYGLQGLA